MNKLLLCVLLLMPVLGFSQGFELGVNGGLCFHSVPINNIYTVNDKPKLGYMGGFKGDLILPHVQIGVGVEMLNLEEYNYENATYTFRTYNYLAKPLINPYLFLNKTYYGKGGYFYAGVMAGPVIAKLGINTFQYVSPGGAVTSYSTAYNSVTGFAGGAQLGFTITLVGGLSLNGEAALRFTSYDYKVPNSTQTDDPYRYRIFYFPMSLGLRYHFYTNKDDKPVREKPVKSDSGYDKRQSL